MGLESIFHSIKTSRDRHRRRSSAIPSFQVDQLDSPATPCPPPKVGKPSPSFEFPRRMKSTRLASKSFDLSRTPLISNPTPIATPSSVASNTPLHDTRSPPADDTQNITFHKALNVLGHVQRSRSLREILIPPMPSIKPLTINNLTAAGNSSVQIGPTPMKQRYGHGREDHQRKSMGFADLQPKRRPVGYTGVAITTIEEMKFDPHAPLADPNMHARARIALTARYQSKFSVNFEPAPGHAAHEYAFLWSSAAELERRVLGDIIWARERYAQAKMDEPTDIHLIEFFDAQDYDPEKVEEDMKAM